MPERRPSIEMFSREKLVGNFLQTLAGNGIRFGVAEDKGIVANAVTIPGSTKVFDFALCMPSFSENSATEAMKRAHYAYNRLQGNNALAGNLGIGIVHDSTAHILHAAYVGPEEKPTTYAFTESHPDKELALVLQAAQAHIEHKQFAPQDLLFADKKSDYTESIGEITKQVLLIAQNQNWSISTTESCTGGFFAQQFVHSESQQYLGGVTLYNEQQKIKEGISSEQLSHGNVYSEEIALAMARAANKNFKSNIAIATTGVMENPDERPFHEHIAPGTVFFAFIICGKPFSGKITVSPIDRDGYTKTRDQLKAEISTIVLQELLQDMSKATALFSHHKTQ